MAERFGNIRESWRLGAAIALLTSGFWYEAHAVDEGIKGNTSAATEYGVEGAILLGGGVLTYNNHNRHMERIKRESATPDVNAKKAEEPMIELQGSETFILGASETESKNG